MNGNSLTCDDQLLLAMLRDELPQPESDDLLTHVESCVHCQQRLSDLVAPSEEWMRITELFSHSSDAAGRSPSLDVPTVGQQPIAWTESMAQQLLSPASHPEMLGRLGRYDVERLIGSGGMGVVFKAFDGELNRPVAIKLLAPYLVGSGSARKRFSREARAAAAVVHQHVVPIHNVETDREPPFIVMQYVSGESLQDRIDREGPLDLREILRIGMQVAGGLSAAHQQGLVHRDIKPSNILLEEDVDRALISDFGLARAADDASLTRTGFHPGTPQYMSPEQAAGQSVDARSDLFSLGSMLYTMCTGRPPFRAENSLAVMRRIADSEPTPIREINPDIPKWLCCLLGKLMAKQKADRFRSASEVHELLEVCLSHVQQPEVNSLPVIPGVPQESRRRPLWKSSNGILAVISVVAILALAGVLFLSDDPDGRDDPSFQSMPPAFADQGRAASNNDLEQTAKGPPPVPGEAVVPHPKPRPNTSLFDITVNGKQGFMDRHGNIVIQPRFQRVYPFSEGLAAARVDDRWGFIDTTGKFVIEPQFIEVAPFSDGRARVRLRKFTDPWGYIDTSGKIVIEPQYDCADDFRKGIARVGMETTKSRLLSRIADVGIDCDDQYIDVTGQTVPKPKPEHYATGEPGELIRFTDQDLVGYVDATGTVMIKPKFVAGSEFSDGLACVRTDDLFGYIDRTGQFVIPPRFTYPNDFSDGLAGVPLERNKWGFIDRTGKTVLPAKYDWIYGGFRDGLAKVTVAGRIGYINKQGEWVW